MSDKLNQAPLRDAAAYEHNHLMTYLSIAAFLAMSSVLAIILVM
jgi:hypothetical protein